MTYQNLELRIMRHKKKTKPEMVVADTVAITHLLVANILFVVGDYTELFLSSAGTRAGRVMVYEYLDFPVYFVLEWFFKGCIALFSSLPLISFVASWFKWFFLVSDDPVFQWMHAEFVIVLASLFYGVLAYFIAKVFLFVLGVED